MRLHIVELFYRLSLSGIVALRIMSSRNCFATTAAAATTIASTTTTTTTIAAIIFTTWRPLGSIRRD